jgi:hypothetical protein
MPITNSRDGRRNRRSGQDKTFDPVVSSGENYIAANENMTPSEKARWLRGFPDEFGFYPGDGRLIQREE